MSISPNQVVLAKQLDFAYQGERTKRFHTLHTIGVNTVGAHSFSIVWLLWLLTNGHASAQLLMAGAVHDMAERITGDMPGHTKRHMGLEVLFNKMETGLIFSHGWSFEVFPEEARLIQMADYMSGMLFCITERSLGNQNLQECFDHWFQWVHELRPMGVELDIAEIIHAKWEAVNGKS